MGAHATRAAGLSFDAPVRPGGLGDGWVANPNRLTYFDRARRGFELAAVCGPGALVFGVLGWPALALLPLLLFLASLAVGVNGAMMMGIAPLAYRVGRGGLDLNHLGQRRRIEFGEVSLLWTRLYQPYGNILEFVMADGRLERVYGLPPSAIKAIRQAREDDLARPQDERAAPEGGAPAWPAWKAVPFALLGHLMAPFELRPYTSPIEHPRWGWLFSELPDGKVEQDVEIFGQLFSADELAGEPAGWVGQDPKFAVFANAYPVFLAGWLPWLVLPAFYREGRWGFFGSFQGEQFLAVALVGLLMAVAIWSIGAVMARKLSVVGLDARLYVLSRFGPVPSFEGRCALIEAALRGMGYGPRKVVEDGRIAVWKGPRSPKVRYVQEQELGLDCVHLQSRRHVRRNRHRQVKGRILHEFRSVGILDLG